MLFSVPANYETLVMLSSPQFYKTHLGQQKVKELLVWALGADCTACLVNGVMGSFLI